MFSLPVAAVSQNPIGPLIVSIPVGHPSRDDSPPLQQTVHRTPAGTELYCHVACAAPGYKKTRLIEEKKVSDRIKGICSD